MAKSRNCLNQLTHRPVNILIHLWQVFDGTNRLGPLARARRCVACSGLGARPDGLRLRPRSYEQLRGGRRSETLHRGLTSKGHLAIGHCNTTRKDNPAATLNVWVSIVLMMLNRLGHDIWPLASLLLVAPVFGEVLSTSTTPVDLLQPWSLVLMIGLYGCGAVLVRELTLRWRLGWTGLLLLSTVYGIIEEGLVDRFWYDPAYWADSGIGAYSAVGHINVIVAAHLTLFHIAVSMIASIVFVEALFSSKRLPPWRSGNIGIVACSAVMLIVAIAYGEQFYLPPTPVLLAVAAVCVVLTAAAFWTGRHRTRNILETDRLSAESLSTPTRTPIGMIAFICTAAHFVSVYMVPATGLPWGVGLVITLVPVAIGTYLIARKFSGGLAGYDALRVVIGIVTFFAALNILLGLGGQYDRAIAGVAIAAASLGLWLRRRTLLRAGTDPGHRGRATGPE